MINELASESLIIVVRVFLRQFVCKLLYLYALNIFLRKLYMNGESHVIWQNFQQLHGMSDHQLHQFQQFYNLLMQHNELFNLTAITSLKGCIAYHFNDSLMLNKSVDVAQRKGIVDVGSGGGFPGIPLAIMYPQIPLYLIEVTKKKVEFLQLIIEQLGLTSCEVVHMDWRTFLRKTDFEVDLFCARASLHPVELLRMLQPACFYNTSLLVYWASETWEPESKESGFIKEIYSYTLNRKHRKLVMFEKPKKEHK